ncbi:MAG: hypothetical protein ACRDBG_17930 [Waterburya sp.]
MEALEADKLDQGNMIGDIVSRHALNTVQGEVKNIPRYIGSINPYGEVIRLSELKQKLGSKLIRTMLDLDERNMVPSFVWTFLSKEDLAKLDGRNQ